jgi:hypothetical protein
MAEPAHGHEHPEELPEGSVSVPIVVGAALLIGLGLTSMAYWLITSFHWIYFAGVVPLAGGGYLLFTRFTGADRA